MVVWLLILFSVVLVGVYFYHLLRPIVRSKVTAESAESFVPTATLHPEADSTPTTSQFKAFINASVDGIIIIDSEGKILDFNDSSERLFGYTKKEAIGRLIHELLIPQRFRKKHLSGIESVLSGNNQRVLGSTIEVKANRKGGGEISVELSVFNYALNGQTIFAAFLKDNTNKKIAEVSLQATMRRLELENKIWTMIDEAQSTLLNSNEKKDVFNSLAKIVGIALNWDVVQVYLKSDLEGTEQMIHSTTWAREQLAHQEFVTASKQIRFSSNVGLIGKAWHDLKVTWMFDLQNSKNFIRNEKVREFGLNSAIAVPIIANGDCYGILEAFSENLLIEDQTINRGMLLVASTFSKLIERQLRIEKDQMIQEQFEANARMSTLGELSSGVAHEINNPLMVLVGQARKAQYFLEQHNPNIREMNNSLAKVIEHSERIAKIVRGLRLFSRDDSHDPFAQQDVLTLIQDSLEICKNLISNNQIEVKTDVPSGLTIECRPGQVSQVLINLIQNAVDAIVGLERPWIRICVTDNENEVEIQVIDSGLGIPSEISTKVFNPFFTTKPVGKGTGLGLSISKGIIDAHKGSFTVDKLHPNTCFVIKLPKFQKSQSAA
jgi:PAS domain S-box-containing protein